MLQKQGLVHIHWICYCFALHLHLLQHHLHLHLRRRQLQPREVCCPGVSYISSRQRPDFLCLWGRQHLLQQCQCGLSETPLLAPLLWSSPRKLLHLPLFLWSCWSCDPTATGMGRSGENLNDPVRHHLSGPGRRLIPVWSTPPGLACSECLSLPPAHNCTLLGLCEVLKMPAPGYPEQQKQKPWWVRNCLMYKKDKTLVTEQRAVR